MFPTICCLFALSAAFSMLMGFSSTLSTKPAVKVMMLCLVKVVLPIPIPLTSLNNQLQQSQLTSALIVLSVPKAPAQGGPELSYLE